MIQHALAEAFPDWESCGNIHGLESAAMVCDLFLFTLDTLECICQNICYTPKEFLSGILLID
jgi:hypothetical protein